MEARPSFTWHPDMLLDGTRMQIAFLKDLVSAKYPTSPYSFPSYLVAHGRLEHFLNLATLYPTRLEYLDYFRWAAEMLDDYVTYGVSAESISPVLSHDGVVTALEVGYRHLASGELRRATADHVSLAPGGHPVLPRSVKDAGAGRAVFHSSTFLTQIRRFQARGRDVPQEFLVVGGGQSAAEIFQFLAGEFPAAKVTLAFRGFGLAPADGSPLANEIFNPEMVDLFHGAKRDDRELLLRDLRSTNYAAVDEDDIRAIAELIYEQRVRGGDRLRLSRFTELVACEEDTGRAKATLRNVLTDRTETRAFDAVVCATGYDFSHAETMLRELEPYLRRGVDGALEVRRDYSVATDDAFRPRIFLHGAAEHTHGLTSTLLSLLPYRAAEILQASAGLVAAGI